MEKLEKFLKSKLEKVNVQVSMLTCVLIIFSCLIIYLVTSAIMVSILTDAYDERANLTFQTIESHLDNRLYEDNMPDGAYGAVMSYLAAVQDNMAISEIFVYRKDSGGNTICVLDTQDAEDFNAVRNEFVTGKIEMYVADKYIKNDAGSGEFFFTENGYRYMNFYPVSSDGRNVKGVIGITIDAQNVHTIKIVLKVLVAIIIFLCCLISIRFSNKIFRKISNPLYQDASNTDALTGLKNKNAFSVDLHNIEEGNTERYSVITIDLNGLKNINDTRGHQAGDIYIQRASRILRTAMKDTEFIGYRVGGDEFSVIVKDKSIDEIKEFIAKVNALVEEGNKTSGMMLTMSIGYAKFDGEKDRNFSMTIERSDAMMYANKRMYYKMKSLKQR